MNKFNQLQRIKNFEKNDFVSHLQKRSLHSNERLGSYSSPGTGPRRGFSGLGTGQLEHPTMKIEINALDPIPGVGGYKSDAGPETPCYGGDLEEGSRSKLSSNGQDGSKSIKIENEFSETNSRIQNLEDKIRRYKQENQQIAQSIDLQTSVTGALDKLKHENQTFQEKPNFANRAIADNLKQPGGPQSVHNQTQEVPNQQKQGSFREQEEASQIAEISYMHLMEKQKMMDMIESQKKVIIHMQEILKSQQNPQNLIMGGQGEMANLEKLGVNDFGLGHGASPNPAQNLKSFSQNLPGGAISPKITEVGAGVFYDLRGMQRSRTSNKRRPALSNPDSTNFQTKIDNQRLKTDTGHLPTHQGPLNNQSENPSTNNNNNQAFPSVPRKAKTLYNFHKPSIHGPAEEEDPYSIKQTKARPFQAQQLQKRRTSSQNQRISNNSAMQNDLKEILESSRNSFASPHPVSQGLDNVRNPVLEHMVRPNAYHIRGRAYSGRALQSSPQSGFERFEGSVSRGSEYQQAVNPLFDNYYQKKREWRDIKNSFARRDSPQPPRSPFLKTVKKNLDYSYPDQKSQIYGHIQIDHPTPDPYNTHLTASHTIYHQKPKFTKKRFKSKKISIKSRNASTLLKPRKTSAKRCRNPGRALSVGRRPRNSSRTSHKKRRNKGKSLSEMQCFIKGVKDLVESQEEFYQFAPCNRGRVAKKKERAIRLICKTIKGQNICGSGKVMREGRNSRESLGRAVKSGKARRKRKKKFKKKRGNDDFDVMSALSKLGGGY